MNFNKGLQHFFKRKRNLNHKTDFKNFYDKFIYLIVILCPLINLPQLFKIWIHHDASGVSAVSWFGFSVISVAWLIYGFLHKDKHIYLMNMALIVMQLLIGIGALIY